MLRSPRARVAAPKPALFGFSRLWFRLPSVLNWLFTIVRFVGLVNCTDWLAKGDVVGQRQFIHTLFGIAG